MKDEIIKNIQIKNNNIHVFFIIIIIGNKRLIFLPARPEDFDAIAMLACQKNVLIGFAKTFFINVKTE